MKFNVTNTRTNVSNEVEAPSEKDLFWNAIMLFVSDPEDDEAIEQFKKDWNNNMTVEEIEIADELNPIFILQGINKDLLLEIAHGNIDVLQLAITELANRGLNLKGEWVGFKK